MIPETEKPITVEELRRKHSSEISTRIYYKKDTALWVKLILEKIKAEGKSAYFPSNSLTVSPKTLYIRLTQGWRYLIMEMKDKMALDMKKCCKIKLKPDGLLIAYCPSLDKLDSPTMVSAVEPEDSATLVDYDNPVNAFLKISPYIDKLLAGESHVVSLPLKLTSSGVAELRQLIKDALPQDGSYSFEVTEYNVKIVHID